MRKLSVKEGSISLLLLLIPLLDISCVNDISDHKTDEGKTPIKLSSNIVDLQTRISESAFSNNDSVGLFVITQPNKLNGKRFVDNMRFTYSEHSDLRAEEEIYYPEKNKKCNFISYYPYNPAGIPAESDEIETSVKVNQSTKKNFSISDFTVAETNGITPSNEYVKLQYKHIFCKIKLILSTNGKIRMDSILTSNPRIFINNVATHAIYNFSSNSITKTDIIKHITPHGKWKISGDSLIGKEMLMIPQDINESVYMTLKINEKVYETPIKCDSPLKSGESRTIIINYNDINNSISSKINPTVTAWTEGEKTTLVAGEVTNAIFLSSLNFQESNVYKVMCNNVEVAEICKEYLISDNINAQAIVEYPVVKGKSDLSNGTLINILGESETEKLCGGKISWNTTDGSLKYLPGNLSEPYVFYINSEGIVSFNNGANSPHIKLKEDLIIDKRNSEEIIYPITKIGTQYWMAKNLKTGYYNTGKAIHRKEDSNNEDAGYCKPSDESSYFFYNAKAISSNKIAPIGWRIPYLNDWHKLEQYIQNNASILKNGNYWKESENPITNLTGLNIVAVGFFNPQYIYKTEEVGYWSTKSEDRSAIDKITILKYSTNTISEISDNYKGAYSVRCLKE